ncbi:MAG: ferredoxin family protein [Myxococcota bacterium]
MAYVVCDPCVKCKYTDCVLVCPVDCFYEGKNTLVIHPDECIDCGACEPECPTEAIFEEGDVKEEWAPYIEINAVFSGAKPADEADTSDWPEQLQEGPRSEWPVLTDQREALEGADEAQKMQGKILEMSAEAGG